MFAFGNVFRFEILFRTVGVIQVGGAKLLGTEAARMDDLLSCDGKCGVHPSVTELFPDRRGRENENPWE